MSATLWIAQLSGQRGRCARNPAQRRLPARSASHLLPALRKEP